MKIAYVHASKFGNGATVAEEFRRSMSKEGVDVEIHHVRDVEPKALVPADLYVFSSPGRMGRPIRRMRRFLKKMVVAPGTRYAVFTTEMAPRPDKRTGQVPTAEERAKHQRIIPIMIELLQAKGMVEVATGNVFVTGMKGPLEDGWQEKVAAFATSLGVAQGAGAQSLRFAVDGGQRRSPR